MHRSYQPIQPTHNKLLQKRWDKTYYNEHINRVRYKIINFNLQACFKES